MIKEYLKKVKEFIKELDLDKILKGEDKKKAALEFWDRHSISEKLAFAINIKFCPFWLRLIIINMLKDLIIEAIVQGYKG